MCTPAEVKAQVYEAFDEEGGLKDQIMEDMKAANNATLLKVLSIYGITIITALIGFTIYITSIEHRVDELDKFADSGERFTQQDARLLELQIKANQAALTESASSQEVQELKEAFIRLDERLRNKGI